MKDDQERDLERRQRIADMNLAMRSCPSVNPIMDAIARLFGWNVIPKEDFTRGK